MQMEVRDFSLISPNHSSKSKMSWYSSYYDSYATSGLKRSVELPSYKVHTINPPSTLPAHTRRQSHSRATRTNKEARSKSHSTRKEEVQTGVSQNENQPQRPLGIRLLSDGGFPFQSCALRVVSNYSKDRTWQYIYPDVDHTVPPTTRKPQQDISDPHVYIGDPGLAEAIYLNSPAVPVADEEAVDSDDSAEYDAQVEYIDASGISQPPVVVLPTAEWDFERQPQQQEASIHPSYVSKGFGETYNRNPKRRSTTTAATSRRKRRESFTPPVPKPSFVEKFLFPGAYREAIKQGKVRNDRVEDWVQAVAKELAKELFQEVAQQTQQYPDHGAYDTATAGHGYSNNEQYQTAAAGYEYSRRRQY